MSTPDSAPCPPSSRAAVGAGVRTENQRARSNDRPDDEPNGDLSDAWSRWALAGGLALNTPVLVALSGGADSVFLARALAESRPRPAVAALHLDHGLRGTESREDADFCRELCRELDFPLRVVRAELAADAPGLEARARRARYRALTLEAERLGLRVILTAHHADDRLETLVQRLVRGDVFSGLLGPHGRRQLVANSELNASQSDLILLRPLLELERAGIRSHLRRRGFAWREDSSNRALDFTRNRIRQRVLPAMREACGAGALEQMVHLGRELEQLASAMDEKTQHLQWTPRSDEFAGGICRRMPRAALARLVPALQRHALFRLLTEATGHGPGTRLIELLLGDLAAERLSRRQLPAGWSLHLRRAELVLTSPSGGRSEELAERSIPVGARAPAKEASGRLCIPGKLRLPDGRSIVAEFRAVSGSGAVPRTPNQVELDAEGLPAELQVRFPEPGDRFHPLGAPGSRRLCRFLRDADVAVEQRAHVPLVCAGGELLWVAGLRPSEARRVRPETERRLRLTLANASN